MVHEEELTACGVRILAPSRTEDSSGVAQLGVEFSFDVDFFSAFIGVAAGAPARCKVEFFGEGVSTLDHETGDTSVESSSIVEAFFHEHFEILDMFGGELGIEHDDNFPFCGFEDSDFFSVGGFIGKGGIRVSLGGCIVGGRFGCFRCLGFIGIRGLGSFGSGDGFGFFGATRENGSAHKGGESQEGKKILHARYFSWF